AEPTGFTAAGTGDGTTVIGDGPAPPELETAPLWAPLLAKGGLSFFLAFCVGYALRTFIKGTMLVIGMIALAIFGLQKAGIVGEINWAVAQGYWHELTAGVGRQLESLKAFITGSLPSAGSAGLGLVTGFRR
ncbi:MAG: FUN14 domain-containing protein, partial [Planctomycetota bacterium]|nr:FUN14 domain-containing protein [Planctomycetota bacterium]